MDIKDIWFSKWGIEETRDALNDYEPLPTVYTVFHKGTPIADTVNPRAWIEKNISVASRDSAEK